MAPAATKLPRPESTVPSSKYDAFISYSHQADRRLAPALQSALNRFARPWYRLRWMAIFRDDTDLGISPHLWSSIEDALARSAYFVLLASPAAARSPWVAKEVEYWRAYRPIDRLLIALTDGDIEWDPEARDFDWQLTTSLPRNLSAAFAELPFYADLRGLRNAAELSSSNPAFVGEVAKLAATIHGKSLRDIFGEELRQRRFRAATVTATVLGTHDRDCRCDLECDRGQPFGPERQVPRARRRLTDRERRQCRSRHHAGRSSGADLADR